MFPEDLHGNMEVIIIPNKNYIVVCNPKLGLLLQHLAKEKFQ